MRIIPAIDLLDGKVVRLKQGSFEQVEQFEKDPVELAKYYSDLGFQQLHLVDLDGAKAGRLVNTTTLNRIAKSTKLQIDYSGGIRSLKSVQECLDLGASKLCIGSLAVKSPNLFDEMLSSYPSQIILAADTYDGLIKTDAWQSKSSLSIEDLISRFIPSGLQQVMSTNIKQDGMMQGIQSQYYQKLRKSFPVLEFIASGGVSSEQDLTSLEAIGIEKVIIGKALLNGSLNPKNLTAYA